MDGFQVYVIHSSRPLNQLKDTLDQCGGYNYVGIIYKSMKARTQHGGSGSGNGKEETKKTIVFCPPQTIRQLELAFPDFGGKVADYNWESFPLPDESLGETWNLHISGVPNDYTDLEAQEFVINSLKVILPQKEKSNGCEVVNYKVEFPPRLRETGEINGYGKVIFSDHVDHDMIKLCKIVLNNTPRAFKNNPKERRMISCTWHRNHKATSRVASGATTGTGFSAGHGGAPRDHVDETVGLSDGLTDGQPAVKYVVSSRAVSTKTVRKAHPAVIRVVDDDEAKKSPKVTQVDMSNLDMATTPQESVTAIKK